MILALTLLAVIGSMSPSPGRNPVAASPRCDEALARTTEGASGFAMSTGAETGATRVFAAAPKGRDTTIVTETSEAGRLSGAAPEDRATVPPPRARSIPARAGSVVRHFASDVWLVVSSPARLDRHGAVLLGLALAGTGAIYLYDQELLDASIRNRDDPTWHAIQEVGSAIEPVGFMTRTIPLYLGATVAGYAFDVRPMREIPVEIIESHLISGLVRNTVKTLVGRRRPSEDEGPHSFKIGDGNSFPSGHTSVLFELATVLSHHAGSTPITVIAYALACTGTLERVHSRSHWPSDLFLSAVSGTMIARSVIRRHERRAGDLETGLFLRGDGAPSIGVRLPLGPKR